MTPHEYVGSAPHTAPEDQVDCCRFGPSHPIHHEHGPEACAVIAAELVACTLGQRSRLELRVDPLGRFAFLVRKWTRALSGLLGAR